MNWRKLLCYIGACGMKHDGPGTWSATCTRCGRRFFM